MFKLFLFLLFACSYLAYQRYVIDVDPNQAQSNPITMIMEGLRLELSGQSANNNHGGEKMNRWLEQARSYSQDISNSSASVGSEIFQDDNHRIINKQSWNENGNPFSKLITGMTAELSGKDAEKFGDNQKINEWMEKARSYSQKYSDVMETNNPNIDFNNGNQRVQSSNDSLQIQSLGEFKEPESGIEFPDFNFQEKLKNLIKEQAEILSGSTLAQ